MTLENWSTGFKWAENWNLFIFTTHTFNVIIFESRRWSKDEFDFKVVGSFMSRITSEVLRWSDWLCRTQISSGFPATIPLFSNHSMISSLIFSCLSYFDSSSLCSNSIDTHSTSMTQSLSQVSLNSSSFSSYWVPSYSISFNV